MAAPESLLPLPRLTEPDELDESELEADESELEADESELEADESEPVPVVDDVLAELAVPFELAAWATAATPIVPPTLSASRVPVATASLRRPWSRPAGPAGPVPEGSMGSRASSCAFMPVTISSAPVSASG
ncbi:MAG: hypothetical protein ACJ71T_03315 [Actinomycetales bacterium]